jgi:hypothetical protein
MVTQVVMVLADIILAVTAAADTVQSVVIANPAGTWSVRQLSDDGEETVCYGLRTHP